MTNLTREERSKVAEARDVAASSVEGVNHAAPMVRGTAGPGSVRSVGGQSQPDERERQLVLIASRLCDLLEENTQDEQVRTFVHMARGIVYDQDFDKAWFTNDQYTAGRWVSRLAKVLVKFIGEVEPVKVLDHSTAEARQYYGLASDLLRWVERAEDLGILPKAYILLDGGREWKPEGGEGGAG